jgi:hypothetical protein
MLISPVGDVSTSRAQAVLHTFAWLKGKFGLFDFRLGQIDSPLLFPVARIIV